MTYADAIAATKGPQPIVRRMLSDHMMIGYLDGSVDVVVGSERGTDEIRRRPAGWGPAAGYTDWQPGEGTT